MKQDNKKKKDNTFVPIDQLICRGINKNTIYREEARKREKEYTCIIK